MMTEGKLVFLPKGYRVVPEEAAFNMLQAGGEPYTLGGKYKAMLEAAPQLATPPVLRWEEMNINGYICSSLRIGYAHEITRSVNTPEARRAAEKALGFPNGLIIDESN